MTYERKPFPTEHDLDLAQTQAADYRPRNRFLSCADIEALPEADWLVKGLIPRNGFGTVYGKPGAGKSFWLLSTALSIGHGLPCFGRRTARGNIAIVAGEGARGLQNRIKAWHQHHGRSTEGFDAVKVLPHPVNLLDAAAVVALICDIHHQFGGQPVEMVVFDTLARCFGDGDENRQADMARLIEAGELVRRSLNCVVVFIHHTPKEADELRGSSVLESGTTGTPALMARPRRFGSAFVSA